MIGLPRVHYRVTDSTNERARQLAAAGAPHGTLVTADEQSAGRGRQGRTWSAEPGEALLLSLVLRSLDDIRYFPANGRGQTLKDIADIVHDRPPAQRGRHLNGKYAAYSESMGVLEAVGEAKLVWKRQTITANMIQVIVADHHVIEPGHPEPPGRRCDAVRA